MANIAPQKSAVESHGDPCHTILWETLTAANAAGDPIQMPGSADRSVQIEGNFDSATVVIEGSNDGTNYHTLTDPAGDPISVTQAALVAITELVKYIRPSTSGGGGSQDIDVTMLLRRPA